MQLLHVACLPSELICVQMSAYRQTRIALLLLHGHVSSDTRNHPVNAVAATLVVHLKVMEHRARNYCVLYGGE